MNFHHIALSSNNIKRSINWYVKNWNAKILYEDKTWGLIEIHKTKLAFVMPSEHPSHICFQIDKKFISKYLLDKTFKPHRDGTSSCYIRDPDGNFLEFLYWPGEEKHEKS